MGTMIKILKAILAYFGSSTYAKAHLRMQFKGGDGKHSGAHSLEISLPQVRQLVQSGIIKLKHKEVQNLFAHQVSEDYHRLKLGLLQYIGIIQPLIWSLWALESTQANTSDVYVFHLAMGAALRKLFDLRQQKTGITMELAEEVIVMITFCWALTAVYTDTIITNIERPHKSRPPFHTSSSSDLGKNLLLLGLPNEQFVTVMGIINECFDAFFEDCKDFHITVFILDPRYPRSDFLINSAAANPVIVIPKRGSDLNIPHPHPFNRMKAFLRDKMLKPMVEHMDTHPEGTHPVLKRLSGTMAVAKFRAKPIQDGDVLGWWQQFTNDPEADILAMLAERVFSILVNSMPDEWTGSRFTWFNSALRGRQHAQLPMDMTVIGQWYGTHATKDKVPEKCPTVKFHDLEDDLKAAISRSSPEGIADMADTATFTLDGSDSDDDSDDLDHDMDGRQRGPPCRASALNIVQEFAIREEAFADLLSDTPRYTATSPPPHPPLKPPPSIPSSDIDWSW
ncbi:hypothetical protein HETIRDRAFT_430831 [Heterobasidion irregulare TC 32-1]|uniref:Uncharacterized protein n=1 Tax=Heterobasidion irregulare (strain TC 32-1) TaxID=747525 RepID=W4JRI9_HETIT|nr:uncharacterized protein HETIRDRAFT_430831 [Heterobasidion irregulare TC 32-1]ETW75486.1 hypothetical protein HETIRDRAFT_430831 [Heterobasidion irregulare TC 32-1]